MCISKHLPQWYQDLLAAYLALDFDIASRIVRERYSTNGGYRIVESVERAVMADSRDAEVVWLHEQIRFCRLLPLKVRWESEHWLVTNGYYRFATTYRQHTRLDWDNKTILVYNVPVEYFELTDKYKAVKEPQLALVS
jgi:hypothetical protein